MANPTLAMIPSGYKAGKVYSVLPSMGMVILQHSQGPDKQRALIKVVLLKLLMQTFHV